MTPTLPTQIRQLAVKQLVKSMVLQYGVDEILHALDVVYKEDVFARARHIEPVKQRAGLLDEMIDRLKLIPDGGSNASMLRVSEGGADERTRV